MIAVSVTKVSIPAMSTIGYGEGLCVGDQGQMLQVRFIGDHRPMRALGDAVAATGPDEEPPVALVPEDAIISSLPVKEGRA